MISSTSSTGSRARKTPRCPGWPPRFRPEGGAFGRTGAWGGSEEGGREELDESWPRRASSSQTRACRVRISVWAAAGVASQTSGGRGRTVSSMPWVYGVTARPASPSLQAGLNAYVSSLVYNQVYLLADAARSINYETG